MSRVVLIAMVLLAALQTPVPARSKDHLTQTMELVRAVDTALDLLPPEAFPTVLTTADLLMWRDEIVPYFASEGITDARLPDGGLVWPRIEFVRFTDPTAFFHVLATTDVLSPHAVRVSARIASPASAWYQRKDTVAILVHELCHAQGIFYGFDEWETWGLAYDVETSASLCGLEVAAAIVANGNMQMLGPLLVRLRAMSLGAVEALSTAEGRYDDYLALLGELLSPIEQLEFNKSERLWNRDQQGHDRYLACYCSHPVLMLLDALAGDLVVKEVLLPINHRSDEANHPFAWSPYGYPIGPTAPLVRSPIQGLAIDDLALVLEFLPALTGTSANPGT